MSQILLCLITLISINLISQDTTQIYTFGGKDLEIDSKYDCSEKNTLTSNDFTIVTKKIPYWVYKISDPRELNEGLDKSISENFNVLKKGKIEFKSFGQEFHGNLYKLDKDGQIKLFISSFGTIKNAIVLIIKLNSQDFDHVEFPIELISITEMK